MIQILQFLSELSATDLSSDRAQAWLAGEVCRILGASSATLYLLGIPDSGRVTLKTLDAEGSWSVRLGREVEAAQIRLLLMEGPKSVPGGSVCWIPLAAGSTPIGAMELRRQKPGFDATIHSMILPLGELIAQAFTNTDRLRQLNQVVGELSTNRQQLLHSRNTLRALFDSSPTSLYIIDRDFTVLAINRRRADLAGQRPQQLVGRRCYEALFGRAQACPDCRVGDTLANGAQTRRIERRINTNKNPAELEISTNPIFGEKGDAVQAFLLEEDVTERRQLEASLLQAEKLAAVGQLAAGVAHEINNPLTVIIANAQLLLRELSPANRDLREMTEIIIKAGKRASESVQDLLDFSRHEQVDLRPTDVNETIRRTLSLVQRELQAGSIDLIFEPDEDLPPVKGSRDQFQSVWLNLIINAKQAIEPGTGEIRISTRRAGDSVQAIVADTGHGIEPDQLGHIFEPFYTTKELGRGTGLGLSICHRIVAQHGGDIHVRSQPGIGTQFTVELPIGMTEA